MNMSIWQTILIFKYCYYMYKRKILYNQAKKNIKKDGYMQSLDNRDNLISVKGKYNV